jgi:hypothetical protein
MIYDIYDMIYDMRYLKLASISSKLISCVGFYLFWQSQQLPKPNRYYYTSFRYDVAAIVYQIRGFGFPGGGEGRATGLLLPASAFPASCSFPNTTQQPQATKQQPSNSIQACPTTATILLSPLDMLRLKWLLILATIKSIKNLKN